MSYSEGTGNRLNKLSFICAIVFATTAQAEMKPISDEELSQYSGQAAVEFDVSQIDSTSYTRVTLGMEADLQINIDTLEAGRFDRGESLEADISISKLGFGSISTDDTLVRHDNTTYAVNEIIPFELNDPFFEIAQDATTDELTGFRIGFGEARGQLSGDFNSISGNVGVDITDYFGDTYRSTMLDATGAEDSVRSTHFGVSNTVSGGATDCNNGFYCYNLADYKTLDVGQRNLTTGTVDYTNDFFISFQKAPTTWSTSAGNVSAEMGAFINIPTSLHIDMNTGTNATGTARVRTEYIDRGNDLF